jgi:hypothetical protein
VSDDRGLTDIALPDLEALLLQIERERIRPPATEAALSSHCLEHIVEHLGSLGRLDAASLQAVLRTAIAERRYRPVPRVYLVWTGPEALVRTARDTLVVVRELCFSGVSHGAELAQSPKRRGPFLIARTIYPCAGTQAEAGASSARGHRILAALRRA